MSATPAATITVAIDDDQLVLDQVTAERLYEELWDVAFTRRSRAGVAAAARMRSLYKLQPLRTIRFAGEEAEAVRQALAKIDADRPTWREAT